MLTMIHKALAGRATRFIAVPTLALAAGAALVLTVSASGLPLGNAVAARACAITRSCAQPAVSQTLNSLHIVKEQPLKALPAMPRLTMQPASPMTASAAGRQANLRALKADLFGTVANR